MPKIPRTPDETNLFDFSLLDYPFSYEKGNILEPHQTIREWIAQTEHIEKQQRAQEAILHFLERFSKNILTSNGLDKFKTILQNIPLFELLFELVLPRFAGEHYRDHLNHTLRTALLANRIAILSGLSYEKRISLILASLLHDCAYPVQVAPKIWRSINSTLSDGYRVIWFNLSPHPTPIDTGECYSKLSEVIGVNTSIMHKHIEGTREDPDDRNHGALAAAEFLREAKECSNQVLEIASAIYLHDSSLETPIDFNSNPLGAILLIADELQEWGRPLVDPKGNYSLPIIRPEWNIEEADKRNFTQNKSVNKINCQLDYQGESFPLIKVLHEKFLNLKRLALNQFPLSFKIEIPNPSIVPPIHLSRFIDPDDLGIKINGRKKKPWEADGVKYSDKQIGKDLNLPESKVKALRQNLKFLQGTKNLTRIKKLEFFLWQYLDSNNFCVIPGLPERFLLVTEKSKFQLYLKFYSKYPKLAPSPIIGELIEIKSENNNQLPNELKSLPVIFYLLYLNGFLDWIFRTEPQLEPRLFWFRKIA